MVDVRRVKVLLRRGRRFLAAVFPNVQRLQRVIGFDGLAARDCAEANVSLSALELDVLRLCALDNWKTPEAQAAWAALMKRVNEAAIRAKLYRIGLVGVDDRITFKGKLELWDAALAPRKKAS